MHKTALSIYKSALSIYKTALYMSKTTKESGKFNFTALLLRTKGLKPGPRALMMLTYYLTKRKMYSSPKVEDLCRYLDIPPKTYYRWIDQLNKASALVRSKEPQQYYKEETGEWEWDRQRRFVDWPLIKEGVPDRFPEILLATKHLSHRARELMLLSYELRNDPRLNGKDLSRIMGISQRTYERTLTEVQKKKAIVLARDENLEWKNFSWKRGLRWPILESVHPIYKLPSKMGSTPSKLPSKMGSTPSKLPSKMGTSITLVQYRRRIEEILTGNTVLELPKNDGTLPNSEINNTTDHSQNSNTMVATDGNEEFVFNHFKDTHPSTWAKYTKEIPDKEAFAEFCIEQLKDMDKEWDFSTVKSGENFLRIQSRLYQKGGYAYAQVERIKARKQSEGKYQELLAYAKELETEHRKYRSPRKRRLELYYEYLQKAVSSISDLDKGVVRKDMERVCNNAFKSDDTLAKFMGASLKYKRPISWNQKLTT